MIYLFTRFSASYPIMRRLLWLTGYSFIKVEFFTRFETIFLFRVSNLFLSHGTLNVLWDNKLYGDGNITFTTLLPFPLLQHGMGFSLFNVSFPFSSTLLHSCLPPYIPLMLLNTLNPFLVCPSSWSLNYWFILWIFLSVSFLPYSVCFTVRLFFDSLKH